MKTSRGSKAALSGLAVLVVVSVTSCAALEDYSRRVGRNACRSAGTCTVYDGTGMHQEPCWPTDDGPMAYPGGAGWPFEKGVCDTVEQMNAPWPEGSDAAHPIVTTSTSARDTTTR